jgi:hypothetical protein
MTIGFRDSPRNYGIFKTKLCGSCLASFTPKHPRQKYCSLPCQKIAAYKASKTWGENNLEKRRSSATRTRYKISIDEHQKLIEDFSSGCGICGQVKKLVVDHDHKTGKIRGMLCISCNLSLGQLGDDIASLQRAILYLERMYG